ncbi:MAG: hypothetical protein UX28_C0003G0171 [Candidatus Pacebacteria bacterium GW2011_GWA1_46_10]|nr:MAG: hypothetical protein UX28_C0003G0171 [Candidatus Pacebacteria bacterium GW2011_GWA1_46_10]
MPRQPARSTLSARENTAFSTSQSFNTPNTQTKPINFEKLLEKYLNSLAANGTADATIRNYRSDIAQFLSSVPDQNSLNSGELRKQLVEKFLLSQREKGLSAATVRRKLISTTQFLQWAAQTSTPPARATTRSITQPTTQLTTQPTALPQSSPLPTVPAGKPAEVYLIPLAIEKVLNQYLTTLKYNSASDATIRNYRSDIKQFAAFIREKTIDTLLVLNNLKRFALSQKEKGLKATSVQRKLTSITQFALWAQRRKLIPTASSDWSSTALDSVFFPTSDSPIVVTAPTPDETVKLGKRKRLKEGWLAGLVLLLLLFGSSIGLYLVQTVQELRRQAAETTEVPTTAAQQIDYSTLTQVLEGNHAIPFSGKLYKDTGEQVTGTTVAFFSLLDGPSDEAEVVWESGACQVKTDSQGIFNINLGGGTGSGTDNSECGPPLSNDVYYGESNLWLLPTIGGQQLALYPVKTVSYSEDSQLLDGAPLGNPVINESVLYMNDQGEVLFADEPTFNVPAGNLTLAGENLYFVTEGRGDILADSRIIAPSAIFGGGEQSPLILLQGEESTAPLLDLRDSQGQQLGVIDIQGRLGLGTTTPQGLIGLGGNGAYISADNNNLVFYDTATGTVKTLSDLAAGGVDTNFWSQSGTSIYYTGGQVGVGTSSTEQTLTVGGNIQLGTTDADRYIYFDNGTSANSGIRYNATNDKIQFSHDGSTWSDLGTTGVTSVTNSDGTLTISPTTGAVVASLNLGHANTWTATQTFAGLTASGTVTFSGLSAGVDNTVLVLNSSNQLVTDEIDSRVWGTTLVDGTGTADYVAYWSDTDTLAAEQYLATARGGLGGNVTALGAGEVLYSTGTTAYDSLAAGSSGQLLTSGGAAAPSWSNIASLLTAGDDIVFIEDGGDVGVGTNAPEQDLTVASNIQLGVTDGDRYIYFDNGTLSNAGFRYNATGDQMEFSNDGTTWTAFSDLTSGLVTSVSNSDGTLTISPTTGDVVASLNLSNANTWLALQTFNMT